MIVRYESSQLKVKVPLWKTKPRLNFHMILLYERRLPQVFEDRGIPYISRCLHSIVNTHILLALQELYVAFASISPSYQASVS